MTGFVELLSPNSSSNVDADFGYGSGWYIGDRLVLTAGHVIYATTKGSFDFGCRGNLPAKVCLVDHKIGQLVHRSS